MDIGERLKIARKKNNITQTELGELLNLTQSTIALIENGKSKLTIDSLILICNEYNISSDWLLFGTENKNEIEKLYNKLNQEEKCIVDMLLEKANNRDLSYKKTGNL